MNTPSLPLVLVSLGLAWGGLLLPAASQANAATDHFIAVTGANQPSKAQKPKLAKKPKPPGQLGTGESKVERDKRLLRECRGKTNAGACEGFAS